MTTVFFIICLSLIGASFSRFIFPGKRILNYGMSFPLGTMFYLLLRMLFSNTCGLWCTLIFAAIFSIVFLFFFHEKQNPEKKVIFDVYDVIFLLLNTVVWLIDLRRFVGYDQLNHFFHAAQIQRGILPPHGFAFSDFPVKYHFGWDILLADLSTVGNFKYADAEDILSVLFIISNFIVLLYILKYLIRSRLWAFTGFLCVIYGSGILSFIKPGNYLCFFCMYHQHAWAFTTSVILFCLACLIDVKTNEHGKILCTVFFSALATSVYSAHAILLWGLFLAFYGICTLIHSEKLTWHPFIAAACVGLILLVFWKTTNWGVLISGETYDNPACMFSIKLLGIRQYCQYMGGYVLMTPIAFGIWITCISYLVKYKFSRLKIESPVILFCGLCVILLYPMPFIFMIANSAYWDNFCKFNYIGVICAWIIFACILYKISLKPTVVKYLCIAITLCITFSFAFSKLIAFSFKQENTGNISDLPILKKTIQTLPYGKILLLNQKLKEHYYVDRHTNKAKVNLYEYVDSYFGKFTFLAMQYGFPVINFYDYNFMYNKQLEYAQIDALNALYRGNAFAFNQLEINYVLTPFEDITTIAKAKELNILEEIASNKSEDWILFLKKKKQ